MLICKKWIRLLSFLYLARESAVLDWVRKLAEETRGENPCPTAFSVMYDRGYGLECLVVSTMWAIIRLCLLLIGWRNSHRGTEALKQLSWLYARMEKPKLI